MWHSFRHMAHLHLIVVLLAASTCACSQAAGAGSVTSYPPQPGYWEGTDISFDVTDDGRIINFKMSADFMAGRTCTIRLEELDASPKGGFAFGDPTDKSSSPQYITGQFTSGTTFAGRYKISVCGSKGGTYTILTDPKEKSLNARWTRPY